MAKWSGTYTEFDESFSLTEWSEEVSEVVVAKDRIALAWAEDGWQYGVTLRPTVEDETEFWLGKITCRSDPGTDGEIRGLRYDLKDGGVILIVTWHYGGRAGAGMYDFYAK